MVRIKISVASPYPPTHPQNAALSAFFRSQAGWTMQAHKNGWLAVAYQGEGEEVKRRLRTQGFADRDFQIRVEYQRGWGFL